MDTISLRHPEDDHELTIDLSFSRMALKWGPLLWWKKRQYSLAIWHVVLSITTFGAYWLWFAKYYNHIRVRRYMRKGYEPLHKRDKAVADQFELKEYMNERQFRLAQLAKNK